MSTETPFIIRGHHIPYYAKLTQGLSTPEQQAEAVANAVAGGMQPDSYKIDVLGDTPSTQQKYKARLARVFTEYVELADIQDIHITVGKKDGVCDSCILGYHCDQSSRSRIMRRQDGSPYAIDFSQGDKKFVDKFLGMLDIINTRGENDFMPESLEPDLILPARSVRAVLKHWHANPTVS